MKKLISFCLTAALALLVGGAPAGQVPETDFDQSEASSVDMTPVEDAGTPAEDTAGAGQSQAGRMRINFESRVTRVEDGTAALDTGKTVLIGDETVVVDSDGSAAEITVGDYVQGWTADPDAAELEALRILVTAL